MGLAAADYGDNFGVRYVAVGFGNTRNDLFGRRQAVPILLLVLAALVEGMGIRAAGRVFGLDPNTVQSWLGAAAEQLSTFAAHFLVELKPEQVQLDEQSVTISRR
jgi:transposase-like protein